MLRLMWLSFFALSPLLVQEDDDFVLSRLYVATATGSYVSYSWGEQWYPVSDLPSSNIRVFSCLGPQVFAGGPDGLFFSNDNGVTWTRKEGWNGGEVVSILPSSYFGAEPTLFAGTTEGLFRSKDAGEQWERLGDGVITGRVNDLAWPGPFLFAATSEGLFLSQDGGDEWMKLEEGLPRVSLLSLATSSYFSQDPMAFVGSDGAGLYQTRDGGETFTVLDGPAARVYSLFWWRNSFFAGTDSGLYVSHDAGETWETASAELESRKVYRILVPAPDSPMGSDIIVGTDQGIFKSSDGALSWRQLTDGLGEPEILGFGSFPIFIWKQQ